MSTTPIRKIIPFMIAALMLGMLAMAGTASALLTGSETIADEYDGRPVHGAIFTTLPFGQAVNANVQYKRKIEVYLDGGPRNPNSLAAGLPNGLYVFQITDPPGKNLLSQDPARCRVVQVKGGVILGTVPVNRIPGYSTTTEDIWGGTGSNAKKLCHVESSESDGASLAGQHDTNADSDQGGGMTVQMMPFLDTPNPGGVYKAWITPLKVYRAKGGALDAMPKPATGQKTGNAPDKGFANPARNNVKTDNFKVLENPPFIDVKKYNDANRDGKLDGDAELSGWPVVVLDPVDGGTAGGDYLTPTGPISIPLGTAVTACEAVQDGWRYSYALVGGQYVTAEERQIDGKAYRCVTVTASSGGTIAIAFGNIKIVPEARIRIDPQDGTNLLPYKHTLTAKVEINRDLENTPKWENAPDGTPVYFEILSGPPGKLDPTSCTTSGGQCSTDLTSEAAGVHKVQASSTVNVDGTLIPVKTDGMAGSSSPATKVWIDAKIRIDPQWAKNGITEPHLLTAKVEINYGNPNAFVNAPEGLTIYFVKLSGPGSLTSANCTTVGTSGACSTTLNSNETGTTVVEASSTINKTTVPNLPADLPADQSMTIRTDGTGLNSGPAVKVWVDAALTWLKHDAFGKLLGGAKFNVRRTQDRFGIAVSTPNFDVLDNQAGVDLDPIAGQFKVGKLPFGRYCVKEIAAPAGYELDPAEQCVMANNLDTLEYFVGTFVNRQPGEALTPGYWKNHEEVANKYLPLTLGDFQVLKTTDKNSAFAAIFAAMNCSSSSDQDAIGCLAGHLLASKLNVANGASTCINPTITDADTFLTSGTVGGVKGINYTGPTGKYSLNASQRSTAIAIKDKLDAYNNNIGCNKK